MGIERDQWHKMVNASAYRKLVHFLWLEENTEPSKISFDELWRKRVSRVYKWMLGYTLK